MATVLMVFISIVSLILAIVKLMPWLRQYWRTHQLTCEIPGPKAYPFVGSIHTICTVVAGPLSEVFEKVTCHWLRYGRTFKYWIAHMCFVFVTDPADLQVVLCNSHLFGKIPEGYYTFKHFLGLGLLTINDMQVYRRHRKAITTSLHLRILQDLMQGFSTNAERLARRLQGLANTGEVFDVRDYMCDCANLNVCETLLCVDVAGMKAKRDAFVSNISKVSEYSVWRAFRPWNQVDFLFWITSPLMYKAYYESVTVFNDYVEEVLQLKLDQAENGTLKAEKRQRETFLEQFLRSGESTSLSEEELVDEVKQLMYGASDTSATLLSFFMVAISIHRNVQENLQKEIDGIFGCDRMRPVEFSDLPHMQYLECVLKEVLRVFPIAPSFGRQSTADVTLPSGYVIPKGGNVVICPWLTHRDERWFPDPLQFDPDRFLPENARGRHPFAFIPFSAGSRSCIGQKYGMMFVKTVAATIIRSFSILPDPNGPSTSQDVKVTLGITSTITTGAKIRLQARKPK